MTDQLFSFYIGKVRYHDAFNLAIRNSDLDKACQVIETHGENFWLPQRQKIEVFNYVQAKHLLANLDTDPTRVFSSSTSWCSYSFLSDSPSVEEFWNELESTMTDLLRNKISYDCICFANAWMKQLFDIIVSDLWELTTLIFIDVGRRSLLKPTLL